MGSHFVVFEDRWMDTRTTIMIVKNICVSETHTNTTCVRRDTRANPK
jgi:hypothetical protein